MRQHHLKFKIKRYANHNKQNEIGHDHISYFYLFPNSERQENEYQTGYDHQLFPTIFLFVFFPTKYIEMQDKTIWMRASRFLL